MKKHYRPNPTTNFKKGGLLKVGAFLMAFSGAMPFTGSAQVITYSFTAAGAAGQNGPTQSMVNLAYTGTNLSGSVTINVQGIQQFTIPTTGAYRIEAWGGQGYGVSGVGGRGAYMSGDFQFSAGQVVKVLVGQQGTLPANVSYNAQYGGAGGSFVTDNSNVPLVVAGGGGGNWASGFSAIADGTTVTTGNTGGGVGSTFGTGGTGGSGGGTASFADGGGGFTGNGAGTAGGLSFTNGGTGGLLQGEGGFGGGGGTSSWNNRRAAGGGGYSGGGAANGVTTGFPEGGGGGSYNAGTNQTNTAGVNLGDGKVHITSLCNIVASGPNNAANPSICNGSSITLTTNAVSNISWSNGATTVSTTVSPTVTTSYTVTGTSTANCIASTVITVTVFATVPSLTIATNPATVCAGKPVVLTASGAQTYTWTGGVTNGAAFNPAASSGYTVTAGNACGTSTGTTAVTVNTVPAISGSVNNPTVCSGGSVTLNGGGAVSYTWSGGVQNNTPFVPSATGNYSVTGTAANGCTATAVVGVTVLVTPNVAPVATPTAICIGSSSTLAATGATNYTWTPGPGSNTLGATNVVSPSATTTYTLFRTNGACPSTTTITVVVNPLPTFVATGSPSLICAGNPATLNAVGAISYSWLPAGFNSANVTVYPNSTMVYTCVASNGSCTANQTVTITVNPAPSISVTASPSVICAGSTASLTASGAQSYTWLATASSPSMAAATMSVAPQISTLYTVMATSAQGCGNSITQVVVVNAAASPSVTSSLPFICAGNVATLTALSNGAANFTWVNNSSTAPSITVNPASTTVYTVTAVDPAVNCPGSATYTLSVYISTFAVSGPTAVCKGSSAILTANGAASSYSWSTNSAASSITVSPNNNAVYIVTGTTGNCQTTQTVNLTVNQVPNVTATAARPSICRLEPSVLTASGAVNYSWSANANNATTAVVTLTPNVTATYTVIGTDANGCSKVATVTQLVNACLGIEQLSGNVAAFNIYPNPNNGNFTIMGEGTMNVSIVNQTGQIVKTMVITETSNQVNVSGMAKGIYFIVAEQDGNTSTKKIVVTE